MEEDVGRKAVGIAMQGKRKRGRPKRRWSDSGRADLGERTVGRSVHLTYKTTNYQLAETLHQGFSSSSDNKVKDSE